MNVPLLRQIKRHITEVPRRFDMSDWGYRKPKQRGGPECGTVGCIAGWAVILNTPVKQRAKFFEGAADRTSFARILTNSNGAYPGANAAEALGISPAQAEALFHVTNWPEKFKVQFWGTQEKRERVRIACRRIEHFIKTGV